MAIALSRGVSKAMVAQVLRMCPLLSAHPVDDALDLGSNRVGGSVAQGVEAVHVAHQRVPLTCPFS